MAQQQASFSDVRDELQTVLDSYKDLRDKLGTKEGKKLLDSLAMFIHRIRMQRVNPHPQEQAGADQSARPGAPAAQQHKVLAFRPKAKSIREERV